MKHLRHRLATCAFALFAASAASFGILACSNAANGGNGPLSSTGGNSSTGGAATGGNSSTGGSAANGGNSSTGGAADGGSSSTGGNAANGGNSSTGGDAGAPNPTVTIGGAVTFDPPGGTRFAIMVAPVDGETFTGPTVDLRFVGVGKDENNYSGNGPGGGRSQAASVQFFVDGQSELTVDAADSDYWVFKGFAPGLSLAPGDHTVFVRAFYTHSPGPTAQVDSRPVTITVEAPPRYGQTVDMSGDLTLAQATSWIGSSSSHIRVNGHGHTIQAPSAATPITWQYVDFYDLGDPTSTASNGIDLTTTGNVTVQNCRFDYSNPVHFSLGGAATADIRDNLFRSNMRQPLGQLPYGDSYPVIGITGGSTGAKTFAGNNVGAGWVDFQAVNHWTVGGDTDADSNVLIGPRVDIHFDYMGNQGSSSNIIVRRNYSDHIYYGGWSQGNNLEAGGNSSLLAEHNVLISSSWTIRGMAGEFRYNLVLMGGEDWMWLDDDANVHHNLFVGGDNNRSGLYNTYGNTGILIQNNTLDGRDGTAGGMNAILVTGSETVESNLFMNLPYTPVQVNGTVTADYNLFSNCTSRSIDEQQMRIGARRGERRAQRASIERRPPHHFLRSAARAVRAPELDRSGIPRESHAERQGVRLTRRRCRRKREILDVQILAVRQRVENGRAVARRHEPRSEQISTRRLPPGALCGSRGRRRA